MVLVFSDLINNLLVQNYELSIKLLVLFGLFMTSIYYTKYVHPGLKPSKYFLIGTVRLIFYSVSKLWQGLFLLVTVVMLHPNVGIDNILLFITSIYSAGFFIFTGIFIANAYFIVPEWAFNVSKIDLDSPEKYWLKKHYMRYIRNKNKK